MLVYSAMEGGTPSQFLHEENKNERKENLMKNFKKVMALLIAAMMIFGTLSFVGAAPTVGDKVIKITGLEEVDAVDFYQILEWKADQGAFKGWSLKTPFDGIVDANDATLKDEATAVETLITGITSKLSGKLAKLANTGAKAGTVNGTEATLTIADDAALGIYIAIIKPKADSDFVYNPVFVSADLNDSNASALWNVTSAATYADNAAAKKSKPGVDKKAEVDNGTSYDQTCTSTRIGEVVHFFADAVIPGYGEVMEHPKFYAKDKMTALELFSVPVVYEMGSTTPLAAGTDYTITAGGTIGADNYTILFSETYLKGIKVPTTITVVYDALVTTDAKMNVNEELNEFWVEYNHDPQNENDYKVQKDDTIHYTYSIDADILGGYEWDLTKQRSGSEIVKVGLDEKDQPIYSGKEWASQVSTQNKWYGALDGAEFALYDEGGTDLYLTSKEFAAHPKESFKIYSDSDGRLYSVFSNGDRYEGIVGLDAGKYYLEEIKAPAGFIRDTQKVLVEIVPTFINKTFTEYWDPTDQNWYTANAAGRKAATFDMDVLQSYEVKFDGTTKTKHSYWNDGKGNNITIVESGTSEELPHQFTNKKGVELPSTGGMGTTLFYAIGAVLVLGAGILLVTKRRMSAY
jgi:LPXTG-motif cell wall-anchored protein